MADMYYDGEAGAFSANAYAAITVFSDAFHYDTTTPCDSLLPPVLARIPPVLIWSTSSPLQRGE